MDAAPVALLFLTLLWGWRPLVLIVARLMGWM